MLYSNRCTAHIALEDYTKAMEDADECIRLQPNWAKGYLRRGSVFFRMGPSHRVMSRHATPRHAAPTKPAPTTSHHGSISFRTGAPLETRPERSACLRVAVPHPAAGRLEKSESVLKEGLELDPGNEARGS